MKSKKKIESKLSELEPRFAELNTEIAGMSHMGYIHDGKVKYEERERLETQIQILKWVLD